MLCLMKQEKSVMPITKDPVSPHKSVRKKMMEKLQTAQTAKEWAPASE